MRKILSPFRILAAFALGSIPLFALLIARAADPDFAYLVGRGKADVTGPAAGVQLWGFVRADQIGEGIHFRLFSRAFVIAERDGTDRIAFASVDLGSITHAMHQEVVERLQKKYGTTYTEANVILSATHTHSGPSGYWHYGTEGPIGMPFFPAHFDAIVQGIVDSISQAHEDLQPGDIYCMGGVVEGAGANRSVAAYMNNPEPLRALYDSDTNKRMTFLRFEDASGPIGIINWFASHPTAMNFFNRLISGDHKGHASARFEAKQNPGFVAAFAQSDAGDVTPNLNLNNTGPGKDAFETTQIIAERQLEVAEQLFAFPKKGEKLSGPIDVRHAYIHLSNLTVSAEFTGAGEQTTCPSAYGYAFAAGSTEDGGGHPLFKEGMLTRNAMIDGTVKQQFKLPEPSDECRACQAEKVILFAPGEMDPPGQSQIVPITLARIGQFTIISVPAEFTTMAGRVLMGTVANALRTQSPMVIAGYANDYAGYVTTREEYATQQYEGGHTLFGPWTLAAYQQEFARLARAMVEGQPVDAGDAPVDMRDKVQGKPLDAPADVLPANTKIGDVAEQANDAYTGGQTVKVVFWSGDPRNDFRTGNNYLRIERQQGEKWMTVATDNDWSTNCRWIHDEAAPGQSKFEAVWEISAYEVPGIYRIVHDGNVKTADGRVSRITGTSDTFIVKTITDENLLQRDNLEPR